MSDPLAPLETVATAHSEALLGLEAPPPCQLVIVEGGGPSGRGVPIAERPVVVGTDDDCDLRLTDERVSRRHLSVAQDRGRFVVRDLGSRNGTLYEGSQVTEARVPPGATLKLGRTFVRIQPQPQPLVVAPSQSRRFGELVAESLAMREVFAVLELAAATEATVLIEGETGTGKELAARAVHEASARRKGPFVAVDCGALPESLVESELFGHRRGAFTGALSSRAGAFARAHGGTVFLDELDSVAPPVQARLLRVVEERTVRPVGADEERAVDVRVIAASRDDLLARVNSGAFRSDLYYRLSVICVRMPPLRARREDIAPIVVELMRRRGLSAGEVAGPNLERLLAHGWPGNVRELRNVVERAVALSPGAERFDTLRVDLLPLGGEDPLAVRSDLPYTEAKQQLLAAFERRYLGDLIARCSRNLSAASRASGLDRKHLKSLLRRHALWPVGGDAGAGEAGDAGAGEAGGAGDAADD